MSTRAIVLAEIEKIDDNGNNKASEVRQVLTELMKYTETVPAPGNANVPFFEFSSDVDGDDKDSFVIWYSFRGIQEQTVNFTFRISGREESIDNFIFEIKEEDFQILRKILPHLQRFPLDFAVPVYGKGSAANEKEIEVMRLTLKEPNTVILQLDGKLHSSTNIDVFTSVHFHTQEFNFTNQD